MALIAAKKLSALRGLMAQAGVSAVIVPTSDAHNSEYVSEHDARRAFISGTTSELTTYPMKYCSKKNLSMLLMQVLRARQAQQW